MYIQTFTVENLDGFTFPFDMLRQEQCWPATEADSLSLLLEDEKARITLSRLLGEPRFPKAESWRRMGWKVVEDLTKIMLDSGAD